MAHYLHLHKLSDPFPFHRGGELHGASIAYETWGTLSERGDNAVLILTGLSADSHVARHHSQDTAGWWEYMVGPGKAIDTERWFVICASSLGSCKGSTGPCSPNPKTREPHRFEFPDLCLEDIAQASISLCRALGVERLKCLIGPSMGGMTAMALLFNQPGFSEHMINIAAGLYSPPFSTAIRSLQREAILKDVNFNDGHYSAEQWPTDGMKLARKIGMLSYRSAEEWRDKFPRSLKKVPPNPFGIEFPIESYLEHHAQKFVHQFDPVSYLYLSRAMDWFDGQQYLKHAAPAERTRLGLSSALVIGAHTDLLFPVYLQQQLHQCLQADGVAAQLHITDSIQGHDAFLVDEANFSELLRDYLDSI